MLLRVALTCLLMKSCKVLKFKNLAVWPVIPSSPLKPLSSHRAFPHPKHVRMTPLLSSSLGAPHTWWVRGWDPAWPHHPEAFLPNNSLWRTYRCAPHHTKAWLHLEVAMSRRRP
jgi:hypothetical protein